MNGQTSIPVRGSGCRPLPELQTGTSLAASPSAPTSPPNSVCSTGCFSPILRGPRIQKLATRGGMPVITATREAEGRRIA
ncbi:hypothetical protein CR201_G0040283 [Pongo abelii]|uniref:Uncharacterized protein n=1 Tax=Pongo abelii TaxID=9601 RepID=A0A2J8XUD9_PONAB|nr:hypothetical protein CR201_G0040283 [Pongo abelii]